MQIGNNTDVGLGLSKKIELLSSSQYLSKQMELIRPRLNDYHDLAFTQEEVDFAIPFLDEDIPLFVDPFLLWKSPSLQDNSLHSSIINSFNFLGNNFIKGNELDTTNIIIELSECNEVGLGTSKTKKGKQIGNVAANEIFNLYRNIPQVNKQGFEHFEEIQLFINGIGKDRISDITCSLIKSFLIDFTIQKCEEYHIPIEKNNVQVFDYKAKKIIVEETYLPINPSNNEPIILVPKRWLRFSPWVTYEDYFENYFIKDGKRGLDKKLNRVQILDFNRQNYDVVQTYIKIKERNSTDCKNDPLFKQIPNLSIKRKLNTVLTLPTGKIKNADQEYEKLIVQMMASLLYPHLDFATDQSRIDSGTQIRDLIFYNNKSFDFLEEIYNTYESKQLVFELKNVEKIEREHINQLNRYLAGHFGRFGIIFTRNKTPKNIFKNTIDLWSGQRRCILILDDTDIELMCQVYESKQRHPIEIIKKKYIEFTRSCPN